MDTENIKKLAEDLEVNMIRLWNNSKYKAEKKKMWRSVALWKEIINSYIAISKNEYERIVMGAFLKAVSSTIYNLDVEDGRNYINKVIEMMKKI